MPASPRGSEEPEKCVLGRCQQLSTLCDGPVCHTISSDHCRQITEEVAGQHGLWPEDHDALSLNARTESGNSSLRAPLGKQEAMVLGFSCAYESPDVCLKRKSPGPDPEAWLGPRACRDPHPASPGVGDPPSAASQSWARCLRL